MYLAILRETFRETSEGIVKFHGMKDRVKGSQKLASLWRLKSQIAADILDTERFSERFGIHQNPKSSYA